MACKIERSGLGTGRTVSELEQSALPPKTGEVGTK